MKSFRRASLIQSATALFVPGIRKILGPAMLCFASTAMASGSYDFCVDRTSPSRHEVLHVRFKHGDIDPGKEAARIITSQRYRQADSNSVSVSDYSDAVCNRSEVDEFTVSASLEQLQKLGNAIGRGDALGAAVAAADIAVGGTVAVVKGAGQAAGGIIEGAKKIVCGILRC